MRKTYRFDYRGQGQAIDPTTQKMLMLHSDTGKLWSGCRLGDKQFQSTIDEGFLWWSDRTRAELRTPWPFSTGRETSAKSGFRQERRRTSRLRQGAARMALSSGVSPRDAEPQEPTSSWWCAHPQEQLLLQTDCRRPIRALSHCPRLFCSSLRTWRARSSFPSRATPWSPVRRRSSREPRQREWTRRGLASPATRGQQHGDGPFWSRPRDRFLPDRSPGSTRGTFLRPPPRASSWHL